MNRLPAIVSGLIGMLILGMWAAFIKGGVFREGLKTVENNQYLAFHVAAETLMGLTLAAGAVGMLTRRWWGTAVALLGWGAVNYSAINSLSHTVKNEQRLTPMLLATLGVGLAVAGALVRAGFRGQKAADEPGIRAMRK